MLIPKGGFINALYINQILYPCVSRLQLCLRVIIYYLTVLRSWITNCAHLTATVWKRLNANVKSVHWNFVEKWSIFEKNQDCNFETIYKNAYMLDNSLSSFICFKSSTGPTCLDILFSCFLKNQNEIMILLMGLNRTKP